MFHNRPNSDYSMCLSPDIFELAARARTDLRMGVPILLTGSEPYLACAAETLTSPRFDVLKALGNASLVITHRRARTLKAHVYDGDISRIILPHEAQIRLIRSIADPADDLNSPMKGPFHSQRGGDTSAHRAALLMCKAAQLLPAALLVPLANHPVPDDLTKLPVAELLDALEQTSDLAPVVSARLPMSASEAGRLHVFRPQDGAEEHYAVEIGTPDRSAPVLARLHSACFTGDVLGSLKCDCGPQLHGALGQMGAAGAGLLLYLNQEGRGIGLANKMRAYSLQDQGFDTVEANHRLGFEDDERNFRLGAQILLQMGIRSVRLLTNNPAKVAMMENCGVTVAERVPLKVGQTPQNAGYLATKAAKSGHLL
jgi:GTP cyclohydrolase II